MISNIKTSSCFYHAQKNTGLENATANKKFNAITSELKNLTNKLDTKVNILFDLKNILSNQFSNITISGRGNTNIVFDLPELQKSKAEIHICFGGKNNNPSIKPDKPNVWQR